MKLNGSNIGKSVALCAFLSTVICRLSTASASEPSRKVVLTDGTNIWPENVIAPYKHAHEMGDVSGLETALASKAALEHTHSQYLTSFTESDPTIAAWAKAATKPTYNWTEILNRPTTWDWANLTNKPTAFTPATHTHTVSAITDFPTTWDWANLTNKPTAFTPADHTHAIADTTGLQAALEALAPLSSVTCTTNAVTYIWQWDEEAGTFALVEK